MPLPLTVSCFSEIQIGFTFLPLVHPDSPGKRAVKRVCVYSLSAWICDKRRKNINSHWDVCICCALAVVYESWCLATWAMQWASSTAASTRRLRSRSCRNLCLRWRPLMPSSSFLFCLSCIALGLTPQITWAACRYISAYPFLLFYSFFPLFSLWFHAID